MQKRTYIVHRLGLAALALTACWACEKEIDVDYRTVAPLYVAEVSLTGEWATASITTTRPVKGTDADKATYVEHAIVTIGQVGQEEWAEELEYKGRGRYELPYWAMAGTEYYVDIALDGKHYTSTSTMMSEPVVNSFRFVWKDMLGERMLFADLRLQDTPDENNFYFMHLYRNGTGYRWAVMRDIQNPGEELQQLFSCTTEREMKKGTGSDVLHEGDRMRLEVRSVDRRAYDYLYSLQLMNDSGSNPIQNFTGQLLGYFSAYQAVTMETIFHKDSIQ